jgi:hypothetical protein
LSKQFTVVTTVLIGSNPNSWVLQLSDGLGHRLLKYFISYCTGQGIGIVILYSPLIATSPGKHDTVELAISEGGIVDAFPITE